MGVNDDDDFGCGLSFQKLLAGLGILSHFAKLVVLGKRFILGFTNRCFYENDLGEGRGLLVPSTWRVCQAHSPTPRCLHSLGEGGPGRAFQSSV